MYVSDELEGARDLVFDLRILQELPMKNLALQPVLVGGLLLADAFELVLLPLRVQVYIAQEFDCVAEIESQDVLEMFPGLLELAEHLRIRWATIDLVVGLLDL